jgi:hypothetical protein
VRSLRFSLALVVTAAAAFVTAVGMREPGHCEVVPFDQTFAVDAQPVVPTPSDVPMAFSGGVGITPVTPGTHGSYSDDRPQVATAVVTATARGNTMRFPLYVTRCE